MDSFSILGYFFNASFAVQLIMLILICISVVSWAFIITHNKFLNKVKTSNLEFGQEFWSCENLSDLYHKRNSTVDDDNTGTVNLFLAGFEEYINLNQNAKSEDAEHWSSSVQRAMYIAQSQELDKIDKHLNFLATAGSISPYIGLLGTVWGIMTTLQALSGVEHATISMVAPGISEALVATALGLFAAIPAVVSYNRFSEIATKIENQFRVFREEFSSLILRQL